MKGYSFSQLLEQATPKENTLIAVAKDLKPTFPKVSFYFLMTQKRVMQCSHGKSLIFLFHIVHIILVTALSVSINGGFPVEM